MDNRRIITPAEALARVRIRERNAPPVRRKIGFSGSAVVSLVDRSGRERVVTEQSNLLLDNGLNFIGEGVPFNSAALGGGGLFNAAAVGTGSTAPDPGDSTLDTEIARTNTYSTNLNTTYPDQGERRVQTITYEFDFGEANGNLTEWGIARGSTTGPVHVRELFRDELGDPITITKTDEFKLRIAYTFEGTVAPITNQAASMVVTGLGTLNGYFTMLNGRSSDNAGAFLAFDALRTQDYGTAANLASAGDSLVLTDLVREWNTAGGSTLSNSNADSYEYETYGAGTFTLKLPEAQWGTARGNGSGHRSIMGQRGSSVASARGGGWAFVWDADDAFTKTDEEVLTVTDVITYTWDRA